MSVITYFKRRRIQKQARNLLKSAWHACNLREDIARQPDLLHLKECMRMLSDLMRSGNWPAVEKTFDRVVEAICRINPPKPYSTLRENIEVLVVALVVAMAFRTYFVQPFKIPTSSMFPTLAGIHYRAQPAPSWSDHFPVNMAKWLVFGEKYNEVRAQISGVISMSQTTDGYFINVGGRGHKVDPNMTIHVSSGDTVIRGHVLASGVEVAGDHIFVNKVKWNFVKPRRGEIMVFKTDGIRHPNIQPNQHYVKRLVGLPSETIGIATPNIFIDGRQCRGIASMDKIQACKDGYYGYIQTGLFSTGSGTVVLNDSQYLACGDNQRNSLDSRYWGPVPRRNMVGPAFFVYWPMSANWGPAR